MLPMLDNTNTDKRKQLRGLWSGLEEDSETVVWQRGSSRIVWRGAEMSHVPEGKSQDCVSLFRGPASESFAALWKGCPVCALFPMDAVSGPLLVGSVTFTSLCPGQV